MNFSGKIFALSSFSFADADQVVLGSFSWDRFYFCRTFNSKVTATTFYESGKMLWAKSFLKMLLFFNNFWNFCVEKSSFLRKKLGQSSKLRFTSPNDCFDNECPLSKENQFFLSSDRKICGHFRIFDKKSFCRVVKAEFCLSRGSVWGKWSSWVI